MGISPSPGEVILAHRGVLLLDELTEFAPGVLTALRRPLDEKVVTISGARGRFTCPCNFTLVATMRPCPCGYHGDLGRECTCSPSEVFQHRRSVDRLLLDRIDVFVEVTRVEHEKLMSPSPGEISLQIRGRVQRAWELQRPRFRGSSTSTNAEMMPQEVVEHCKLEDEAHRLLQTANERLHLSTRAFYRLLKLSRTIADLAGVETIRVFHLAEALQYRPRSAV
ncbi:MAG: ATP-binding protein [Chloroflexota bacterium]|nr:ATP-binding protein [Chloroflexota bacterium]